MIIDNSRNEKCYYYIILSIANEMALGFFMTLVGLINAMVGGTMTIIPVLTITSGYLPLILGCLATGIFTCYTILLLVSHLGKASSVR